MGMSRYKKGREMEFPKNVIDYVTVSGVLSPLSLENLFNMLMNFWPTLATSRGSHDPHNSVGAYQ